MNKAIILNYNDVIKLTKVWKKINTSNDMSDYEHGVCDGLEFVLFLTERMED